MSLTPLRLCPQQFLAMGIAWALSGVLTAAGAFPDDPTVDAFRARTDARVEVMTQAPWIYIPYPCEY